MRAEYINPFLESARHVIEQVIQVRPETGKLGMRDVIFLENYIWINIGVSGQMEGDIIFGLHEAVALRVVSAMMGGFVLTEFDDLGRSAISELGNMISGNASTLLYNRGIRVDITPPRIIHSVSEFRFPLKKAITIPLIMDGVGELDIQVLVP